MHRRVDRPERGELDTILEHNGRFFRIFQTGGPDPAHFTYDRGRDGAEETTNAEWAPRIPQGSVVNFAVDADAKNLVMPYSEGMKST
ncbi:glycoside hydrolase domain-containing protein [Brachybacterium paraconglomeratum]|uniref:glycoside hydrolase domain-containing protein n=1 Tax=Brachybacterium paraconglomeratum TaxID=173362 RepID=UPI003FD4826F